MIAAVFNAGFLAYAVDPVNVAVELVRRASGDPAVRATSAGVHLVLGFGAALVIAAALIRTWGAAHLTSDVVHDTELRSETLVADGPYRYVRNPLYLGLWLLSLGFALAASRLGFVIIAIGITAVVLRLIGREERELARVQGERFEAYRRAVPRLVPSLRPRVPATGARPRPLQAVLGEAFAWVLAVGAVVFATTEDPARAGIVVGVGMVLYLLLVPFWRRRRTLS